MRVDDISPAVKHFFRRLEKESMAHQEYLVSHHATQEEISVEQLEKFFRSLKTQNIFIHAVGNSGKPMSALLEKAIFNLNKVIRVYYSTSFDESEQGYVRIRIDYIRYKIVVERMHGHRPVPDLMYSSKDECHVLRFMVGWLLKRIDWSKTKIDNLELYKRYIDNERQEMEDAILAEQERVEKEEIQAALERHFGKETAERRMVR